MAMEKEKQVQMYTVMARIRAFEERARKLFAAGVFGGFVHLSAGQEATPVGACANLTSDDYITSTHRGQEDRL